METKLQKLPAWDEAQVNSEAQVIRRAKFEGEKVQIVTLMDLSDLKKPELEGKFQKYTRRLVLRGDVVKDASVNYAVFTEQGVSASQ